MTHINGVSSDTSHETWDNFIAIYRNIVPIVGVIENTLAADSVGQRLDAVIKIDALTGQYLRPWLGRNINIPDAVGHGCNPALIVCWRRAVNLALAARRSTLDVRI